MAFLFGAKASSDMKKLIAHHAMHSYEREMKIKQARNHVRHLSYEKDPLKITRAAVHIQHHFKHLLQLEKQDMVELEQIRRYLDIIETNRRRDLKHDITMIENLHKRNLMNPNQAKILKAIIGQVQEFDKATGARRRDRMFALKRMVK